MYFMHIEESGLEKMLLSTLKKRGVHAASSFVVETNRYLGTFLVVGNRFFPCHPESAKVKDATLKLDTTSNYEAITSGKSNPYINFTDGTKLYLHRKWFVGKIVRSKEDIPEYSFV